MKEKFRESLRAELDRIDSIKTSKRNEKIIEGFHFENGQASQAVINGKRYMIFNSNDYLGLRLNKKLIEAERLSSEKYGSGPGAVRFISGTLKIYPELENELAKFHGAEAGMTFSSSFAANMAVIHCFIKCQSKNSKI